MKEKRFEDKYLTDARRIHMIGIGGSGMCPLAHILHDKGYTVTGSDNNESDPLNRVKALGIKVTMGHFAENVHDSELVVYSAAISKDNPELVEADKLSIPTMERSHLLGALTRYYDNVIGVCGTHGKTSVTSMTDEVKDRLETEALNKKLEADKIDITLPSRKKRSGTKHPITLVRESIEDLFLSMGYDIVDGPEIETDEYCFEMLNVPKGHPARDAQDTFYITDDMLLRTQTSAMQIRYMLAKKEKDSFKMICPGKTYRRDDDD
jgi:phenylalanyl-tRNA synthetase alpha subunit